MGAAEGYVAALVEENLGLPVASVSPESLPSELVGEVRSLVRGEPPREPGRPYLEEMISSFGDSLANADKERWGYHVRKAKWPGAAPYAVCLTHDVDNISRPWRHMVATRNRFRRTDLVLALLGLRSLYDNLLLIAAWETELDVRSSFYLLSGNYPLKDLRKQIIQLKSEGFEFGLHGDFGTHNSAEALRHAKSVLEKEAGLDPKGVREHYLKFDFPHTWELMEESGFEYDTTVGYSDRLGFRLGLCTPFSPPDSAWNKLHLIEIPLTMMETTLWGYMKASEVEGAAHVEAMLGLVRAAGGLFTLLWHPESVRMRGGRTYERVLGSLVHGKAFVGRGIDVANWWRRRSTPIRRDGGVLRMSGTPKDVVLELTLADGRRPQVEGGIVSEGPEKILIIPTGPEVSVKVS